MERNSGDLGEGNHKQNVLDEKKSLSLLFVFVL